MGYAYRCQQLCAHTLCGQTLPGLKTTMLAVERGGGRPCRVCRLHHTWPKGSQTSPKGGGEAGKAKLTLKTGLGGGGRTMPTPLPSASSWGATAWPSDSPQGATALIAKTPFFFERRLFEWTVSALPFFWEIQPLKKAQCPGLGLNACTCTCVRCATPTI